MANSTVDTIPVDVRLTEEEQQNVKSNARALGFLTNIAVFKDGQEGSLAKIAVPTRPEINVVNHYMWTLSNVRERNDIPYIELFEHSVDGGAIQKQFAFYAKGAIDTVQDLASTLTDGAFETKVPVLDVYKEIFVPNPTGFIYKLPYFSKTSYELSTNQWQQFDSIGGTMNKLSQGIGALAGDQSIVSKAVNFVKEGAETAKTALEFVYPVVGIADRPRIFTAHNERSITIEFPLYNTARSENSWKQNKDLIQLLMYQNLFNKRNFITGLPPVWYQVRVPGVYYSVASCVTSLTVENLGNTRMMTAYGKEFLVPDAYQVRIVLQEMAMPSKNQFETALTGQSQVNTALIRTGRDADIFNSQRRLSILEGLIQDAEQRLPTVDKRASSKLNQDINEYKKERSELESLLAQAKTQST